MDELIITDELLWQEIYSLREKLKIAIDAIEFSSQEEKQLFIHRLGSVDYDQLMEEINEQLAYDRLLCTELCENDLLNVGFEKIPCFTVTNEFIYKLGRHRHLSVSHVGTPNEMLWICETDDKDGRNITNLICLHNYDYDGYLTIEKIKGLINLIVGNERNKKFLWQK